VDDPALVVHDANDVQLHVLPKVPVSAAGGSLLVGAAPGEPYIRRADFMSRLRRANASEESRVKIQVHDAVSYAGRDYIVEGVLAYASGGDTWQVARAVDGETVLWIEPPHSDLAQRPLVLREIRDLDMSVPPPSAIAYHDLAYVQRLATRVTVGVDGRVPERVSGSVMLWRYRAAGDLYLQLEEGGGRVAMLAGETVHPGMIEVLPGH
jgi:hypothetical protein